MRLQVEEELETAKDEGGKPAWRRFINPIIFQAFTMTGLAEWGDRSQVCICRCVCWRDRERGVYTRCTR